MTLNITHALATPGCDFIPAGVTALAVSVAAATSATVANSTTPVAVSDAACFRLENAVAAVLAPVPPSAIAKSVIPVTVPADIATVGMVTVPVNVGLARLAFRASDAVTSALVGANCSN